MSSEADCAPTQELIDPATQAGEEGVSTPATCDASKDSSNKPSESCKQSEASSKRRKNVRRKKRGAAKLPNTPTRIAALLGQIKEICKKEPSVASKVEPLLEQATRILETLIVDSQSKPSDSPHNHEGNSEYMVAKAGAVVSGQRIPPHVYRPVSQKAIASTIANRSKNQTKITKKAALSTSERTALEKEHEQAAIRSRLRNARTPQEIDQALADAENLGMTHEVQHAKAKKEKLLVVA